MSILNLPYEIIELIMTDLSCGFYYNFIRTTKKIYLKFGKEKFKKKFMNFVLVKKYLNNDYNKFKYYIQHLNEDELNKILILSVNNIETVWLNETCGFYNLKYIFECIYNGGNINDINNLNHTGKHFYRFFYNNILINIVKDNREETQKNVDNCVVLKNLHTQFRPYIKNQV
tara:strand:+ start:543 stop:1058 length:516 start_codon:yes stop_codon:yes gene_type:complete